MFGLAWLGIICLALPCPGLCLSSRPAHVPNVRQLLPGGRGMWRCMLTLTACAAVGHAGVGAAILPGGIVVSDPPRMHESASCGTRERACAAYIYLHPYHTLDM